MGCYAIHATGGLRLAAVLAALCLLSACAGWPSRGGAPSLPLLQIAPDALGERTVEQRLTLSWPAGDGEAAAREQRSLEAVLDIADGRLRLILLAAGMRLMSMEYDGVRLAETRHAPLPLSGQRVLNDLLLIAAPLEALRPALPPDWRIEEFRPSRPSDGACRREIWQGDAKGYKEKSGQGVLIAVIDYAVADCRGWSGRVEFDQRVLGYHLSLESHEL